MSARAPDIQITELDRVDIAVEHWSWKFAIARRDEIDRHFAQLQRDRLGVWNGRVLLLNRSAISGRVLRGTCFETDYASFCAWRSCNFADPAIANVFAAAALEAADGAFLVGEMAPYTAAAGQLYFPAGTPEPDDIDADGKLDLADNVRRELKEETGLDIGEFEAAPGWCMVRDRNFVALLKRLKARENAPELRSRIMRYLASVPQPELVDIRIVRAPGDLDSRMPGFVIAFLEKVWRQ
jgi:8-oxo-dGTP pyrophosphatase MutT (NUDIX family)